MRDETERYRMMIWPGAIPPVREIEEFSPYQLDGELLKLDLDAQMTSHVIPDELYLRGLYELDLDKNDQILKFINSYGRLGHPAQPIIRKGAESSTRDRQIIRLLGVEVPDDRNLPWLEWLSEIENGKSANDLGVFEKDILLNDGLQHLDNFKAWVVAFRRLTRLYQRQQAGEATVSDLSNLGIIITDLLRPFGPVLWAQRTDGMDGDLSPTEQQNPRLENVLALQIFNHVAQGNVYLTCANETHRGLFVFQQGRGISGQNRSKGVKYCSSACAKAQASRVYRRRRKGQTREEN